jgi:phage repressor protein C with HTH and peptisase S24 domain
MPASVIPITARRRGAYVVLEAALAGRLPQAIGVLVIDPETDRLWVRLRQGYEDIAEPEDAEVLEALEGDIRARAAEMGAERYIASMEDSLSNAVRVSERHSIAVDSFTRVADRLYGEQVEPLEVKPYVTHVPLYTLRAAAGKLGEEMESAEEDWVRAPEDMHLDGSVFAAHVVGRSMEPRIPDGSLNLFRFHPVGSRQGKILLVERFGAFDETARYTIKRYSSQKIQTGEDQWRHERIRLEPLNPEFEAWDAGPEDFAVVAEWLRVIE